VSVSYLASSLHVCVTTYRKGDERSTGRPHELQCTEVLKCRQPGERTFSFLGSPHVFVILAREGAVGCHVFSLSSHLKKESVKRTKEGEKDRRRCQYLEDETGTLLGSLFALGPLRLGILQSR